MSDTRAVEPVTEDTSTSDVAFHDSTQMVLGMIDAVFDPPTSGVTVNQSGVEGSPCATQVRPAAATQSTPLYVYVAILAAGSRDLGALQGGGAE